MNFTIPQSLLDTFDRLTSRKFGIVILVIYLAVTNSIPVEAHDITIKLVFGYLVCETLVDIAYAVFNKEIKNDKIPPANPI